MQVVRRQLHLTLFRTQNGTWMGINVDGDWSQQGQNDEDRDSLRNWRDINFVRNYLNGTTARDRSWWLWNKEGRAKNDQVLKTACVDPNPP